MQGELPLHGALSHRATADAANVGEVSRGVRHWRVAVPWHRDPCCFDTIGDMPAEGKYPFRWADSPLNSTSSFGRVTGSHRIADDVQLHHASTGASIYGQKTRSASVSAQSNFRFRCYRTPNTTNQQTAHQDRTEATRRTRRVDRVGLALGESGARGGPKPAHRGSCFQDFRTPMAPETLQARTVCFPVIRSKKRTLRLE